MSESENPYLSPQEVSAAAAPMTKRQIAKKQLFQPGLVTLVSGAIMALVLAYQLPNVALRLASDENQYNRDTGIKLTVIFSLVLVSSLLCIYGGIQMLRVRQYPVCVLTSIAMALPFASPCNLIGLAIGLWTLIVLLRKGTRAAFAEAE